MYIIQLCSKGHCKIKAKAHNISFRPCHEGFAWSIIIYLEERMYVHAHIYSSAINVTNFSCTLQMSSLWRKLIAVTEGTSNHTKELFNLPDFSLNINHFVFLKFV
jgi:hypothetical protein